MKQKNLQFLLLFLMGCVLTSCEKVVVEVDGPQGTNTTSKPTNKNVVIRVADIDMGWDGASSRSQVNISEVCTRLCFAVYQNDSRVKNENQQVGDSDFGTFALQLDAGTYQVLALGHSAAANPATTNPSRLQFTNFNPNTNTGMGFTDTFYYYGDMVVNSDGAQVSISMKRATSMFRLVINDDIPANVKKFQFYYTGGSGTLDATTGLGCVNSQQSVFVTLNEEQKGKPFEMYTFLREETGNVTFTVKAFDANENIIYTKEFTDVLMKRNCITQYSGNFFTDGDSDTPELPGEPETPDTPQPDVTVSGTIYVDSDWAEIFEHTY